MISLFRRFWSSIFQWLGWSRSLPTISPPGYSYSPPTLDQLRTSFGLEGSGTSDGQRELPPSDATELTETERALLNQIHSDARELKTELLAKHAAYLPKIKSIDFNAARSSYLDIPSNLEAHYRWFAQKEETYLHQLEEDVRGANQELQRFRSRNQLARPARYPESHWLHWGFFALLAVSEAAANSYFFSKGNEFGLAGGFVQAIVFAGINVGLGAFIGRALLPNLWSGHFGRKFFGFVATPAAFAVAVGYSLAVAHFRDAFADAPQDASALAVQSLLSDPTKLRDFDSWVLFLVGIMANLAASIDTFLMDDCCPGYGRRDRGARRLRHYYAEELDKILTHIEVKRREALDNLEKAMATLRDYRQRIWTPAETFNSARLRTQGSMNHLESLAASALQAYRTANIRARSTPGPRYFDEAFRLPEEIRLLPELDFLLSEVEEVADAALSAHDEYRERINSSAAQTSDRFRSLKALGEAAGQGS